MSEPTNDYGPVWLITADSSGNMHYRVWEREEWFLDGRMPERTKFSPSVSHVLSAILADYARFVI